jgi:RNA polymerase sigma-70 factor (ECF subfamily)
LRCRKRQASQIGGCGRLRREAAITTPSQDIADLIARCALRDRAAFRLLYQRTSAKLFGVTLRILKDRSEAEEAIQEVYVKIWQRADRYVAGNTSPISWLVAVARNHSLDILRARRPVADDIDVALDIPDAGPSPERAAQDSQERGRIEHCLGRLEPDRAEAVRGAYLDGYSYEELASRFAVPLNTMRTWLRRSLIKLKECLTT